MTFHVEIKTKNSNGIKWSRAEGDATSWFMKLINVTITPETKAKLAIYDGKLDQHHHWTWDVREYDPALDDADVVSVTTVTILDETDPETTANLLIEKNNTLEADPVLNAKLAELGFTFSYSIYQE